MIFLARHGEPDWPEKTYLGQLDPPLSEEGRRQSAMLGTRFRASGCLFERVYTSPLVRCVQTSEILLKAAGYQPDKPGVFKRGLFSLRMQTEPDLAEIDLGGWDGRMYAEIKRLYPEEYEKRGQCMLTYQTPGGESFEKLRERVLPCFARIAKEAREEGVHVLIVAHAGVNRMILDTCLRRGALIRTGHEGAGLPCGQREDGIRASKNAVLDAATYTGDFMTIPQSYASCCWIDPEVESPGFSFGNLLTK